MPKSFARIPKFLKNKTTAAFFCFCDEKVNREFESVDGDLRFQISEK